MDEVVPAEGLRERVMEIAGKIAEKPALALRLSTEILRAAQETRLPEGLARGIDLFPLPLPERGCKAAHARVHGGQALSA